MIGVVVDVAAILLEERDESISVRVGGGVGGSGEI